MRNSFFVFTCILEATSTLFIVLKTASMLTQDEIQSLDDADLRCLMNLAITEFDVRKEITNAQKLLICSGDRVSFFTNKNKTERLYGTLIRKSPYKFEIKVDSDSMFIANIWTVHPTFVINKIENEIEEESPDKKRRIE